LSIIDNEERFPKRGNLFWIVCHLEEASNEVSSKKNWNTTMAKVSAIPKKKIKE